MRPPPSPARSRTRGHRTATAPIPVMISRLGRCPWRTSRRRPSSVNLSVWVLSQAATSASLIMRGWFSLGACGPLRTRGFQSREPARGRCCLPRPCDSAKSRGTHSTGTGRLRFEIAASAFLRSQDYSGNRIPRLIEPRPLDGGVPILEPQQMSEDGLDVREANQELRSNTP